MAKIGDTVRFLNDVGGGMIVRIEGRTAWVEDADGFEQPMDLNQCIVVPSAEPDKKHIAEEKGTTHKAPESLAHQKIKASTSAGTASATGFSIALIFEPQDIRRLSQTTFDLYLVNDTNYTLLYSVSTRDRLDSGRTLLSSGEVEPCTQAFLGESLPTELNRFENIAVHAVAFKESGEFEGVDPICREVRFDVTRLAKLHCFTPTAYSTRPVLTIPIVTNGKPAQTADLSALYTKQEPPRQESPTKAKSNSQSTDKSKSPEVIDLHASELLETTAGLEPADILAHQLNIFDRHMTEAAKHPGRKIIFIHGKGEGVLRRALLDRLRKRWPRCEAQDASFLEYGFGATQITIHR